ncbi:MAG: hypothetical protein AVDCRST_MAG65-1867, partial [uncultured Solirubrobacteraceae bacterium]
DGAGLPDPDGHRSGGRDGQHDGGRSVADLLPDPARPGHPAADRQRDQHVGPRPHGDRGRAGRRAGAARTAVATDLPGGAGRPRIAGRRRPAARLPGRDLRAAGPLPHRRLLAAGGGAAVGGVAGGQPADVAQPWRPVVQHADRVLLRRLLRRCRGGALPRPRGALLERHDAPAQRAQERPHGDRQRGGDGRLRLPRRSPVAGRRRAGHRVADRRSGGDEAGALHPGPRAAAGGRGDGCLRGPVDRSRV